MAVLAPTLLIEIFIHAGYEDINKISDELDFMPEEAFFTLELYSISMTFFSKELKWENTVTALSLYF